MSDEIFITEEVHLTSEYFDDFIHLFVNEYANSDLFWNFIPNVDRRFINDPQTKKSLSISYTSSKETKLAHIILSNSDLGTRIYNIHKIDTTDDEISQKPSKTLPLPEFSSIMGPASQAFRRAMGGTPIWTAEPENGFLRSNDMLLHEGIMSAVVRADQTSPVKDSNDHLQSARNLVDLLGPDEADWFDLIFAKNIQVLQSRNRNDLSTWAVINIDDLKRARTKDYNGFRDKQEKEQHRASLRRVLDMNLLCSDGRSKDGKTYAEFFHYFHSTEIAMKSSIDGPWDTIAYRVYPSWWFEAEILANIGFTVRYHEAALKMVLHIPSNKTIAKSVARYLVNGFWRQRAFNPQVTEQNRYKIPLGHLFDYSGIVVPAWAISHPSQYAKEVYNQLSYLTTPYSDAPLLRALTLVMPKGMRNALDKFFEQDVELLPHLQAPSPIINTIAEIENNQKNLLAYTKMSKMGLTTATKRKTIS